MRGRKAHEVVEKHDSRVSYIGARIMWAFWNDSDVALCKSTFQSNFSTYGIVIPAIISSLPSEEVLILSLVPKFQLFFVLYEILGYACNSGYILIILGGKYVVDLFSDQWHYCPH